MAAKFMQIITRKEPVLPLPYQIGENINYEHQRKHYPVSYTHLTLPTTALV